MQSLGLQRIKQQYDFSTILSWQIYRKVKYVLGNTVIMELSHLFQDQVGGLEVVIYWKKILQFETDRGI